MSADQKRLLDMASPLRPFLRVAKILLLLFFASPVVGFALFDPRRSAFICGKVLGFTQTELTGLQSAPRTEPAVPDTWFRGI